MGRNRKTKRSIIRSIVFNLDKESLDAIRVKELKIEYIELIKESALCLDAV